MESKLSKIDYILTLGEIVISEGVSSIYVDTDKYYLTASLDLSSSENSCELLEDGEPFYLTKTEYNYIISKLENKKEEINNAFTGDDLDHFESLIH
tara:strand:- start:13 stop:300 length:288 start_codon:yes stop_codon:yes gene_type:complete